VIALIGYERRVYRVHVRTPSVPEAKASPTPVQAHDEQ